MEILHSLSAFWQIWLLIGLGSIPLSMVTGMIHKFTPRYVSNSKIVPGTKFLTQRRRDYLNKILHSVALPEAEVALVEKFFERMSFGHVKLAVVYIVLARILLAPAYLIVLCYATVHATFFTREARGYWRVQVMKKS